jgi:hypothetical protein
MSLPLPGDPASCSYAGGALRQLATRLRVVGRQAHEALDALDALDAPDDGQAPGAAAEVRARRRADALDRVAAESTRQLDRLGSALQAFATDLAESQASAARVAERAEAAGLRLGDGVLAAQWGVSGVADPHVRARQDAAKAALQSDLDTVTAALAQRRQRLLAILRETRNVLDEQRRHTQRAATR